MIIIMKTNDNNNKDDNNDNKICSCIKLKYWYNRIKNISIKADIVCIKGGGTFTKTDFTGTQKSQDLYY